MYYLYNKNPEVMLFGVCCFELVIIDDYLFDKVHHRNIAICMPFC